MENHRPQIYSLEYWRELLIPKGFDRPFYHRYPTIGGQYVFRRGYDRKAGCLDLCLEMARNNSLLDFPSENIDLNHIQILYNIKRHDGDWEHIEQIKVAETVLPLISIVNPSVPGRLPCLIQQSISEEDITQTVLFKEFLTLLDAIENPDLLPTCIGIPWTSRLVELLIKEWTENVTAEMFA